MKNTPIAIEVTIGPADGHIPGRNYRDVQVSIVRKTSGRWIVNILETWGSCQGRDEEHGRKEVVGRGDCLDAAVAQADKLAMAAEINPKLMAQALSQAAGKAEDAIDEALAAGIN